MLKPLLALPLALGLLIIPCGAAKKKPPAQPVNLNTANSEQLQQVPGIGPATADKILQMRKSYGSFKSVNDLMAIRGIGPKRLEKMKKYLTVNRPTAKKSVQPASCPGCSKEKPRPPTKAAAVQKSQSPNTPPAEVPESEEP
jgi:competence ComEA-like helix-hairpin-helix protein